MILWTAPRWSPTCRLKCRLIAEPGHDRAAWVEMVGYRWELVAEEACSPPRAKSASYNSTDGSTSGTGPVRGHRP